MFSFSQIQFIDNTFHQKRNIVIFAFFENIFENVILKDNNFNDIILWISKHVVISQGRRLSTYSDHFDMFRRSFIFEKF